MILSQPYRQSFWKGAGSAAKKCWNLPNTLIGFFWGILGVLFGAKITFGNNAIQFENHPFMLWGAITIGNTISYPPGFGPDYMLREGPLGRHELQHTFQGELLGPLYLPANAIGGVYSVLTTGTWHNRNFMESGPMALPPRPF